MTSEIGKEEFSVVMHRAADAVYGNQRESEYLRRVRAWLDDFLNNPSRSRSELDALYEIAPHFFVRELTSLKTFLLEVRRILELDVRVSICEKAYVGGFLEKLADLSSGAESGCLPPL